MKDFLEALFKLVTYDVIWGKLGISQGLGDILAGIINTGLVALLTLCTKFLAASIRNYRTACSLRPYFSYRDIKLARRFFIPTRFQNESPAREDEPRVILKFVASIPLITHMIRTAFNEKKEDDRFYLVLADSGMGKTTFMINLYIQYTRFFHLGSRHRIRLFPLGDSRVLDIIKKIPQEEAAKTILLLDALDEDPALNLSEAGDNLTDDERFRRRLDEIIEAVQDFREVVITCRTQYFPGQEKQEYALKVRGYYSKGYHTLVKMYISPFNDKEIRRYLRKKYGILRFWNSRKKKTALEIINHAPRLMVRPMLLGYIDLLVDSSKIYKKASDIYKALIDEWLVREAKKRKHKSGQEKFKTDLLEYSRLLTLEILKQQKKSNSLKLSKDQAVMIAKTHLLDLKDYEITGQSLLTRDAEGSWKFAHKSIYEYLVAREAAANTKLLEMIDFTAMDMTDLFLQEICPFYICIKDFVPIKGGTFLMGSPAAEAERAEEELQHKVKVDNYYMSKYPVTVEQFEAFSKDSGYLPGGEWCKAVNGKLQADKNHPVIRVSWNDAVKYCNWLSQKAGQTYRLPTEAEWEYACRAGTATPFNTGENLTTDQANYDGNHPYKRYPKGKYLRTTTPVKKYPPNAWGLYDMHGNVREWCLDWYDENYYAEWKKKGTVENPQRPEKGSYRVLRGGGWRNSARLCRSAYRIYYGPGSRDDAFGFRLVFVPSP